MYQGDSGGPLLSRVGDQHTVIGIGAWASEIRYNVTETKTPNGTFECKLLCWPGTRNYFTQVGLYTEWIKQKMTSPTFCLSGASARN